MRSHCICRHQNSITPAKSMASCSIIVAPTEKRACMLSSLALYNTHDTQSTTNIEQYSSMDTHCMRWQRQEINASESESASRPKPTSNTLQTEIPKSGISIKLCTIHSPFQSLRIAVVGV